jgi:Flp pilus assembly pilin Flp
VTFLRRLCADRSGATAAEYGLIVAFIALGMSLALATVGNAMTNIYLAVNNATSNALTSS